MTVGSEPVDIESRDFWFKIVEMLQQNWALVDQRSDGVVVWFVSDTGGVFDELTFPTEGAAASALRRNEFRRYSEDSRSQRFISPPSAPFIRRPHPNGRIYSSGRFWK